jgi:hypothetical protein
MTREANSLTPCRCTHVAFEHHFNRYLGCEGKSGRGKCAIGNCSCISYEPVIEIERAS